MEVYGTPHTDEKITEEQRHETGYWFSGTLFFYFFE